MMCLGWFNQMDCNARPTVEVLPATQTAAEAAGVTGSGNGDGDEKTGRLQAAAP